MVSKRAFVQTIRPAKGNEINADGVQKFDIKVPVYSAEIIDKLNASDKTADSIRAIMRASKPKNEITREKPKFDGFANVFDVFNQSNGQPEYTDVTGVLVDVVGIIDNQPVMFSGTIERQNGLIVSVKVGDTYLQCPIQGDCWFFN